MAPVSTLKINNHIPLSCTFCTWDSLLLLTIYCMNTHDVYIKKIIAQLDNWTSLSGNDFRRSSWNNIRWMLKEFNIHIVKTRIKPNL